MKKLLLILSILIFSSSIYASNLFTNNRLMFLCKDETFCQSYFIGFLDGINSETKLKEDAFISAATIKQIYFKALSDSPEIGDHYAPYTIGILLEINNFAIKKDRSSKK